ncbi:S-adenosyl-L-methionine-dependent methyltransferase [Zopfochytrium polystomum]|nr:S-adenosyl-L-methionine-dependent methyltransferase [Zopfochytrium polystomum]
MAPARPPIPKKGNRSRQIRQIRQIRLPRPKEDSSMKIANCVGRPPQSTNLCLRVTDSIDHYCLHPPTHPPSHPPSHPAIAIVRQTDRRRDETDTTPTCPSQRPTPNEDNLITSLRKKAKDANAYKAAVDDYLKNWEADKRNLANTEDATEERRLHSKTYTNAFYDLVTDFYEYGKYWDSSFHQNLARHESFLALKLGLKPGMRVLDCGCGVGGPLREIAKLTGAHITGINNNEYQVKRTIILAAKAGLSKLCTAVQGDFCDMQFANGSFDAAYGIEATLHAPRLEDVYGEIFRVLKPGRLYEEADLKLKKIVHLVEEGNSVAKFYTIPECIQALKNVGFDIVEFKDLADNDDIDGDALNPWYEPLVGSYNLFDVSQWCRTPLGRTITDTMVSILEFLRIAPPGTSKVSRLLNSAC